MSSPLDLIGRWSLHRSIEDRHAARRLRVEGTTELVAVDADQVDWRENGTLHAPDRAPVEVTRRLRVVRRDEGWWVLFEHGGAFHPWSPEVWVDHPCGADHYRGLVEIESPQAWRVTWRVSGPDKDYTMISELTRP